MPLEWIERAEHVMGIQAKTLANKNFHNIIVLHSSRTKQMRTYLPALHISKAST